MKKLLAMLLALGMMMSLAACGEQKDNTDAPDDADTPTEITYAVEAGSAGEAVANEKGWKVASVGTQADALMEVSAGTSDAAIIDLLMADAMVGENTSYPDLKVGEEKLTTELYGVGCRKGSDLASFINSVLAESYADGSMAEIAKTYGVSESALVEQPAAAEEFVAAAENRRYPEVSGRAQERGTVSLWIFHGDRAYVRKFQKEAGEEEPGYDRSQQFESGRCRIRYRYQCDHTDR